MSKENDVPPGGPMLLLVEANSDSRRSMSKTLQNRGFRIAIARNIAEALEMIDDLQFIETHGLPRPQRPLLEMIDDLQFIETEVDGLVVEYQLSDGLGCRIVQDFQRDFPNTPTALVINEDNIAMRLWTRARGISLMQKHTLWNQLEPWLEQVKVAA